MLSLAVKVGIEISLILNVKNVMKCAVLALMILITALLQLLEKLSLQVDFMILAHLV